MKQILAAAAFSLLSSLSWALPQSNVVCYKAQNGQLALNFILDENKKLVSVTEAVVNGTEVTYLPTVHVEGSVWNRDADTQVADYAHVYSGVFSLVYTAKTNAAQIEIFDYHRPEVEVVELQCFDQSL